MNKPTPCVKGGMSLNEALDSMCLAYNPITKQLQFVTPKVDVKKSENEESENGRLSKKGSFSDEGNYSLSTCEKSDTSGSPKSTLQWSGHTRGKDGGSFSSTISSLSEYSLSGSNASRDGEEDEVTATYCDLDNAKFKKKGISNFFSRGVFPWKSASNSQNVASKPESNCGTAAPTRSWRLFGSKSTGSLSSYDTQPVECESISTPLSTSGCSTPHYHKRQGSSASEKQFEDLIASSIALIQHERPSNLPAKCSEEASRHRWEHEQMVQAARRRGEREVAARRAKVMAALKHEETLSRAHAKWATTILPKWDSMKSTKQTRELWWNGLPPSVRGKVWCLSIEDNLNITTDLYYEFVAKAKSKLTEAHERRKLLKLKQKDENSTDNNGETIQTMHRNHSEETFKHTSVKCAKSKSNPNLTDYGDECSIELIEIDIARTFPHLCIFQPGGPYFEMLQELLGAYVCYRPDIGYVQGMSFIAAVLILNMEPAHAFVCFANLLEWPVLKAAFTRDGLTMQCYWSVYEQLVAHNIPCLSGKVAPELYLMEWLYSAYAKAMSLDAVCRVWDLMLRDGDEFLFRTALGVLHMYQDDLKEMDFIDAAQFLTKLPEDLSIEILFNSILTVNMSINGCSFQQLVDEKTSSMEGNNTLRL